MAFGRTARPRGNGAVAPAATALWWLWAGCFTMMAATPPIEWAATAQSQTNPGALQAMPYKIGQELGFGGGEESFVDQAAVANLKRESSMGKKDAQYYLGILQYYGEGVPQDKTAALSNFRKAAEQGHLEAMVNVGLVLYTDKHSAEDAAAWFLRAAKAGNADAQWMLGRLHYDGRLESPPDFRAAYKFFKESAEQNNPNGLFYAGLLKEYGRGVPLSFGGAADLYKKASDQGHMEATYNLGLMYAYGRGVEKDYARAAMLFEKASTYDHGPACIFLATMHLYGNGVLVDYKVALAWFKRAQKTGDERVKEVADKGVEELTRLMDQAEENTKKSTEAAQARYGPPPERLDYVAVPRSRDQVEKQKQISQAVGDAQARKYAESLDRANNEAAGGGEADEGVASDDNADNAKYKYVDEQGKRFYIQNEDAMYADAYHEAELEVQRVMEEIMAAAAVPESEDAVGINAEPALGEAQSEVLPDGSTS